MTVHTVH